MNITGGIDNPEGYYLYIYGQQKGTGKLTIRDDAQKNTGIGYGKDMILKIT